MKISNKTYNRIEKVYIPMILILLYTALFLSSCTKSSEEVELSLLTSVENHKYVSIVFHIGDSAGYIRDILGNNDVLFEEIIKAEDYLDINCYGETCEYKIVMFKDSLNRIESSSIDGSGVILPKRYHD